MHYELDVMYLTLIGFVMFRVKDPWDQMLNCNEQLMFIASALVLYVVFYVWRCWIVSTKVEVSRPDFGGVTGWYQSRRL